MQRLLVPTPSGKPVPLSLLADVRIEDGPNQVQREDAKRRITVGFNVRGRDVQSIVEELQGKVDAQLDLPVGYYTTYGGAFENLVEAKKRLARGGAAGPAADPAAALLRLRFLEAEPAGVQRGAAYPRSVACSRWQDGACRSASRRVWASSPCSVWRCSTASCSSASSST